MSMQEVGEFSEYPSLHGNTLTEYDLSGFKPKTEKDLTLLQMTEGVIDRKKFYKWEGWPPDGWLDGKNTNIRMYWARDLVKGEFGFINGPLVRRFYNLVAKEYTINIITPDKFITTGTLESDEKDKIESELKEIFSK